MANQKYDNLMVLMSSGWFNWAGDPIMAVLLMDAVYDAADVTMGDIGGTMMGVVPLPNRSVGPDGSLLGASVSFNNMPKETDFQMVIVKETGPGQASALAFYDEDSSAGPLRLVNNGTLIVRPEGALPAPDTGQGIWVSI